MKVQNYMFIRQDAFSLDQLVLEAHNRGISYGTLQQLIYTGKIKEKDITAKLPEKYVPNRERGSRKVDENTMKKIYRDFKNEKTDYEIAVKYGLSTVTVWRFRKEYLNKPEENEEISGRYLWKNDGQISENI